jgi:osmotically-inducible protein OsmY
MALNRDEIRRRIIEYLAWDSRLDSSGIDVDVFDSTARLHGSVSSLPEKTAAENDTWIVAGVKTIINDLEIHFHGNQSLPADSDIEGNIRKMILWVPEISSSDIDVKVNGGVVYLNGSVDSYHKKMRLEELTAETKGVVRVINLVTVVPSRDILDRAIADRIIDEFNRQPGIPAHSIDVEVVMGKVTLTGSVPDWNTFHIAFVVAERLLGVRDVDNRLVIMRPGE